MAPSKNNQTNLIYYSVLALLMGSLYLYSSRDEGPPKLNEQWGACYNSQYAKNHPSHSKVDNPVYVLMDQPYVREEVYPCMDEFAEWIQSPASQSSQWTKAMSDAISIYLLCRQAARTHEECDAL